MSNDSPPEERADESADESAEESSIAPRPRPGFKSRREAPIDVNAAPQMLAAAMGGGLGVVALAASMLYFPPHAVTPVLAGVSVLMITRGAYGAWKVGVAEPRMKTAARICAWGLPAGALAAFLAAAILGPGGLAPDWAVIVGTPQPAAEPTVTFTR